MLPPYKQQRNRGRSIDPYIHLQIQGYVEEGVFSPNQVYEILMDQEMKRKEQGETPRTVPSLRTVERVFKDHGGMPKSPPPPWDWKESPPEDVALVFRVLDAFGEIDVGESQHTGSTPRVSYWNREGYASPVWLTRKRADWIIRVSKVAPSMSPLMVAAVAATYEVIARSGFGTDGLDVFLAMHPWESVELARRWREAVMSRRIPPLTKIFGDWSIVNLMEEELGVHDLRDTLDSDLYRGGGTSGL